MRGPVVQPALGDDGRIFPLYRRLAGFLTDPVPDRRAAIRRALGDAYRPAAAAYGPGLVDYLLDQMSGLGPADAIWAAAADRAGVSEQVRQGLARARALLAAVQSPPVFLMFSRRFDGRSDGRNIFLGVDRFGEERLRDQVGLLAAHEYSHIVRAAVAPFSTLLDAIIAEGLATACSELVMPGLRPADYLLYPPGQIAWYTAERLAPLWADLGRNPVDTSPARRARYLEGGVGGPFGAPPRSGYYLGYLIARAWLGRGISIARLTRMHSAELWLGSGYAV